MMVVNILAYVEYLEQFFHPRLWAHVDIIHQIRRIQTNFVFYGVAYIHGIDFIDIKIVQH